MCKLPRPVRARKASLTALGSARMPYLYTCFRMECVLDAGCEQIPPVQRTNGCELRKCLEAYADACMDGEDVSGFRNRLPAIVVDKICSPQLRLKMRINYVWDDNTKRFILIESRNSIYYGLNNPVSESNIKVHIDCMHFKIAVKELYFL